MKTRSLFVPALALVAAALAACSPFDSQTAGDNGRAEFAYADQCFLDCALDHPVAVGSTNAIVVSGDGAAAGIAVASSDEKIASFTVVGHSCSCQLDSRSGSSAYGPVPDDAECSDGYQKTCSNRVEVAAHAQGDARLTVTGADGAIIDTTTVSVRRAASVSLQMSTSDGSKPVDALSGHVGDAMSVRAVLIDADGDELLSAGAAGFSVADAGVATTEATSSWFDWSRGVLADVHFVGAGDTTLSVSGAGATAAIPLHVDP